MKQGITDAERKVVLELIFSGATPPRGAVKKPARDRLEAAGLIRLVESEKPGKRGKKVKAVTIELTDRAWAWAGDQLALPFVTNVNTRAAMNALLERLAAYLAHARYSLAQFMEAARDGAAGTSTPVDLHERVRATYFEVAGSWNHRARLTDVRTRLADIPREQLDQALRELLSARRIILYPLDDPRECRADDVAAAIVVGGEPKHIMYMEG